MCRDTKSDQWCLMGFYGHTKLIGIENGYCLILEDFHSSKIMENRAFHLVTRNLQDFRKFNYITVHLQFWETVREE